MVRTWKIFWICVTHSGQITVCTLNKHILAPYLSQKCPQLVPQADTSVWISRHNVNFLECCLIHSSTNVGLIYDKCLVFHKTQINGMRLKHYSSWGRTNNNNHKTLSASKGNNHNSNNLNMPWVSYNSMNAPLPSMDGPTQPRTPNFFTHTTQEHNITPSLLCIQSPRPLPPFHL